MVSTTLHRISQYNIHSTSQTKTKAMIYHPLNNKTMPAMTTHTTKMRRNKVFCTTPYPFSVGGVDSTPPLQDQLARIDNVITSLQDQLARMDEVVTESSPFEEVPPVTTNDAALCGRPCPTNDPSSSRGTDDGTLVPSIHSRVSTSNRATTRGRRLRRNSIVIPRVRGGGGAFPPLEALMEVPESSNDGDHHQCDDWNPPDDD